MTIEPGVKVIKPTEGDMFLLHGEIYAHGTTEGKIIFNGGDNSNIFYPQNSNADTFLDLEYCLIEDGKSFWPATGHQQYGHFSLRHSKLKDFTRESYIWYPEKDVYIEYNTFENARTFSIGHSGDVKVYIRYNLFNGKNPSLPSYQDFIIENWASYGESETVVKYNSFLNIDGIILSLPSGYDDATLSASDNYWGTDDTGLIDSKIFDKNDDISCAGYIDYLPILTEPHPDTPTE